MNDLSRPQNLGLQVPLRQQTYSALDWVGGASLFAVPPLWRGWLSANQSLTAQLKKLSAGDFRVELLCQQIAQPHPDERSQLNLASRQLAMIRDVLLHGCGRPWVLARTVVPLATLTGPLSHLRRLGIRPLGEALFAQRSLQRSGFEFADCRDFHFEVPAHYGRRSRFTVAQRPLLVAEIFLEPFLEKITAKEDGFK